MTADHLHVAGETVETETEAESGALTVDLPATGTAGVRVDQPLRAVTCVDKDHGAGAALPCEHAEEQ